MSDDTNVETFPQQQATERKGRPTIAEIMDSTASVQEKFNLLVTTYPELTVAEARKELAKHIAELDEFAEQLERESAAMKMAEELVKPVWKDNPGMTFGHALKVVADQGDPQAKALLEHLRSPAMRLEEVLFDKAVGFDPYWEREGDHYRCREGAAYETPEELIRVFVQSHRDEILSELPDDLKEAFEARY